MTRRSSRPAERATDREVGVVAAALDVFSQSTSHMSTLADTGEQQTRERCAEQALDLRIEERYPPPENETT
jgi:hypothetical protein